MRRIRPVKSTPLRPGHCAYQDIFNEVGHYQRGGPVQRGYVRTDFAGRVEQRGYAAGIFSEKYGRRRVCNTRQQHYCARGGDCAGQGRYMYTLQVY